ncbi:autotransporter assembly complex protein TamA [Jannaschia seohaensis]|uniref:Translocation and assembly module TamA n=1 Tax=Jannaschia seohaensis TaxID=475081 RepID=A0A2Y9A2F0_9RHOB|nr:autotransporter assembly complex family protein [Jannaschia seohaensis]PWJ22316.1 translocation and assembly module TamA [Jannaschia seohaensis]SSA38594.1 translocation and assembly module TamA [Jannaschia seohaensis]
MTMRTGLLAAALLGATGAAAAELEFRLAGGDKGLGGTLEATSLVAGTLRDAEDGALPRRDIVAAAQADYARLLAALYEQGYFGPVISIEVDGVEATDLPVIGSEEPVGQVVIAVEPGPLFVFGQAEIAPLPEGIRPPPGFETGARAGTSILRQATSEGVEAWRAIGHAKAELGGQQITANHPDRRVDARLSLAPGPRLRYGAILIEGNEAVRSRQIDRIADLDPGDVFDPEEIRDSARRLQRTGAFRSVSIVEAAEALPDATLPMTIQVVERLPRRIGFGAEIGTTEGAALSAFWLHRNLTGFADSFRAEAEIRSIGGESGGEDYRLGALYTRPATFNPETDLFVGAEIESLDEQEFSSDRAEVFVGARRIVSDEFQYSYGLSLEYSDVTDGFGDREFLIASIPLEAQYDRRDDPLNPTDGYYIDARIDPFYGFETAGPGVLLNADLRGYQGFGAERNTVLAARLQLGTLVGPDLEDAPTGDLFFSGGGGTVRGQPFQSLSLELPSGREVGGRSFVGVAAEIRQKVTENIGVVGFVDWGQISESSSWSGGESHAGAGLGVRYDTGIGPIRVDLAVPVAGPDDNSGFELYIGIGQAF